MMNKFMVFLLVALLSSLCFADECRKECKLKYQLNQSKLVKLCDDHTRGLVAKQICISKAQKKANKDMNKCVEKCPDIKE
jgi:hypothetical protein